MEPERRGKGERDEQVRDEEDAVRKFAERTQGRGDHQV